MDSSKFIAIYQTYIYSNIIIDNVEEDDMFYDDAQITIADETREGGNWYKISVVLTKGGVPIQGKTLLVFRIFDPVGISADTDSGIDFNSNLNITNNFTFMGVNNWYTFLYDSTVDNYIDLKNSGMSSNSYFGVLLPNWEVIVDTTKLNLGVEPG